MNFTNFYWLGVVISAIILIYQAVFEFDDYEEDLEMIRENSGDLFSIVLLICISASILCSWFAVIINLKKYFE